jgi:hypothetical protein
MIKGIITLYSKSDEVIDTQGYNSVKERKKIIEDWAGQGSYFQITVDEEPIKIYIIKRMRLHGYSISSIAREMRMCPKTVAQKLIDSVAAHLLV